MGMPMRPPPLPRVTIRGVAQELASDADYRSTARSRPRSTHIEISHRVPANLVAVVVCGLLAAFLTVLIVATDPDVDPRFHDGLPTWLEVLAIAPFVLGTWVTLVVYSKVLVIDCVAGERLTLRARGLPPWPLERESRDLDVARIRGVSGSRSTVRLRLDEEEVCLLTEIGSDDAREVARALAGVLGVAEGEEPPR